jgi:hypothetical protein
MIDKKPDHVFGGTMTERWLPVAGFEGYEVSDLGNVRSPYRVLKPSRLTPRSDYRVATLRGQVKRLVHHLVLEAFVGPCPAGQQARHLNDMGEDNRLVNLAWGTLADNRDDARKNGFLRSRHSSAKADEIDVVAVREAHANGVSLKKLSRQHKTSFAVLRDIVHDRPVKPYFLQSRVNG